MNATQKKKISSLILERLRTADLPIRSRGPLPGKPNTTDLSSLNQTLEELAHLGFETVVRHRSRQGERYYNRSRRFPHQRAGEARFKYDPEPKGGRGKIYLNLLTCCRFFEPNDESCWKQIWVCLPKETALKALVLGFIPETIES